MRKVLLPSGRCIILSDTVGFIADLPPMLIDAFKATLEELQTAQIILHIYDIAIINWRNHIHDVEKILSDLHLNHHEYIIKLLIKQIKWKNLINMMIY